MKLTPINPSIPVRIDTSAGTRVFAGTTMITGDTGTRDVSEIAEGFDFSSSTYHKMTLRRVGNQVYMEATGVRTADDAWLTKVLPAGFRPRTGEYNALRGFALSNGRVSAVGNSNTLLRLSRSSGDFKTGDTVTINTTWFTNDGWPTTLPGTPV